MVYLFFVIGFLSLLAFSLVWAKKSFNRGKNIRKVMARQVLSFFLFSTILTFGCAIAAHAENTSSTTQNETTQTSNDNNSALGWGFLAMGIAIGVASLGAGIAVAGATPAAIGATAEDPKNFGKSLVLVAMGEGVTIFSFLVCILIYSKLP